MAIYNSNPTSPKSESPTYRSEDSSPQKPQREGSRVEAAPPDWATDLLTPMKTTQTNG